MDNSFFIRDNQNGLRLKRFHICSWEFNNSCLIEFGMEVDAESIKNLNNLILDLYVPWATRNSKISDFYGKLNNSENSRFIFNDSVSNTIYLDDGQNLQGVIHEFSGRNKLCLLPIKFQNKPEIGKVSMEIDLTEYKKNQI
ncbi:hypothetical protein QQ008_11295 [Fulvivirgaceae bacterium BMA10]|uniref:Uncharacterized protein n=1 Tax=Splendidivirga corallicola TaxID=3051826 RepID=A0ABT8KML5_9BACT|nr:hypothetical protein [Fulvivirgaceae bacterium BMA10]